MSKEDIRYKLSALQSRLSTNKAIILADPEPYIEKIHGILCDYQKVIAEIERAVSPDVVFDCCIEMGIHPNHFQGVERVQVDAVKKALEKLWGVE